MRTPIHSFLKISILGFAVWLSGCNPRAEADTTVASERFEMESFTSDEIPNEFNNQIEGAGCAYSPVERSEKIIMMNGLVKINGLWEILEESQQSMGREERYENERWILIIQMSSNGDESGKVKLRSKTVDGSFQANINRFCGT